MTSRTNARFLLVGTVTVLAWGLSACGSDGPDAYTAPIDDGDAADVAAPSTNPVEESSVPEGPVESVPASGEVVDVRALDNTFIEEVIEVDAGTEVHWENRGRNDHDVVPVAEDEQWGVELEDFTPGDSYSHVFSTPGTYSYFCTVHGTADVGMVGTVIVR